MEMFVIQVENNKALFFKELIENFDFAKIIKIDNVVESRIYPATDFEIKLQGDKEGKGQMTKSGNRDSQYPEESLSSSSEEEQNIKQIRDAMSKINRVRDKYRK